MDSQASEREKGDRKTAEEVVSQGFHGVRSPRGRRREAGGRGGVSIRILVGAKGVKGAKSRTRGSKDPKARWLDRESKV